MEVSLGQVALLLAAAALAAPVGRAFAVGTVLGYLVLGVVIGPFGVGRVFSADQTKEVLHFAEFGVVLLLFLIGLELRPTRLWSMRASILGAGGGQVAATGLLIAVPLIVAGLSPLVAVVGGLALALSSTPFALQLLEERGEVIARHGRLSFAVLLFQDLAAIPLIAFVPLLGAATLAQSSGTGLLWSFLTGIALIGLVIVVGRYTVEPVFRMIARTKRREAMTAAALLVVVGVAFIMQFGGLSAPLGAFIAGALLADSSYRHQLEADLQPFEGLLLGIFFIAIGMSLDLRILAAQPLALLAIVGGLVALKGLVLFSIGRMQGLDVAGARRMGIVLSQSGEFGFVLFGVAAAASLITASQQSFFNVVITLSMMTTPLLLLIDDRVRRALTPATKLAAHDAMPEREGHVVIAGFGRVGQITARILRAKNVPFIALDLDPEQIALVRRFGSEAYFGDVSRPEVLEAARIGEARVLLLAIDDVETSLATARMVRERHPELTIVARARNRAHVHRLMDVGVNVIRRETFHAALDLTSDVLRGLGHKERDIGFLVETFAAHDERRLIDDYRHYSDEQKLQLRARTDAETLSKLFSEDRSEPEAGEQGAPRSRKETV